MADSLIFHIGFDLEKGVKEAQGQMDVVLRRLQKTVDGKPLTIPVNFDSSRFTTFESALRGSIQHITADANNLKATFESLMSGGGLNNINKTTEAMRALEAAWKEMPHNLKFDVNNKLTPEAQKMVKDFNELTVSANTYGQTLTQITGKIRRAAEEESKVNQKRNDGYAKLRKTLGAQENSITNLTAKIKAYQQILNSKEIGSKSFERVAEKIRKLTEKLDAARVKVKTLTQTTVDNSKRQVAAHKDVTTALGGQHSYLGRLIKRMAIYSSFAQFRTFISSVKEVTAQFELQRVSLGAIIQDQNRANQLFSEIKTFALKSPISIMDLTKYTKQVAAYRIENDKLFDTTKRLADVSVGLGVDMGRLVLAFGQVKAASFLRSAEIRQFTEAGIPMLELLAEKFSELQGRAVSTEQVMKMVENRMVDFRMVEQIFTDLTSAGGMFYNMQEKQGNTLFGLWAKLGDAASVMYDEIGNTDEATYVMKEAIQTLTDLMRNWRFVGREAIVVGATLMVLYSKMKLVSSNTKMAEAATNSYTLAQRRLNAAQAESMTAKAAEAAKRAAVANRAAAISTNAWTAAKFRLVAAVNQLKAALLGNWVTLAIAAFAAIGVAIYSAYEKAHRLDNELNKIRSEGSVVQDQSVENFNRLAKAAVESANGSKQQRDALEELSRTYKDILPTDALKLENLRKLKGNYDSLTQSVREYIALQQKEKAINSIQEEYGADIEKIRKTLYDRFTDKVGPWRMSEEQFSAFWAEFVKQSGDATKTFEQRLRAAFETTGKDAEEMMNKVALYTPTSNPFGENYLEKANRLLDEQRVKIEAESKAWDKAAGGLGKFYDKLEQAKKELSETRFISRGKNGEEVGVDKDTFLYQQMQANAAMKKAAQLIREDDTLKQAIQDKQVQLQPEWIHLVDSVNPNDLMNITYVNFDAIIKAVGDKYPDLTKRLEAIKKEWGNVVPNDGIVRLCQDRLSQIANGIKGGMDVMRQYLWNGSGTVDEYLKTLNNQISAMEAELFSAEQAVAKYGVVGAAINFLNGRSIGDVKEQLDGLREMAEFVQTLVKPTETPTTIQSDPRLQNLKEEISLTKKLYDEYHKLEKQIGATKAAEKIQEIYKNTISTLEGRAQKYGFKFELPFTDENLKANMQHFIDKMKELQGLKDKKGKPLFPNIGTEIDKAVAQLEDVDLNSLQKALEKKLKELADRISRTKTAKEFYEKILSTTGDYDLAAKVSLSIYGENGDELKAQLAKQIKEMTGGYGVEVPVNIISADNRIDYLALERFVKSKQKELGGIESNTYKELVKIAQDGQKDLAKSYVGYLKDLEKAKTYSDKRIELARYTANQIAEIDASALPKEEKARLIAGYREREDREAANLEWEAFKDMPMYVQMFDDLDHASTRMLTNMRDKLMQMQGAWNNLDPTQLKELQSRLNEVESQLVKRNPFKTLVEGLEQYRALRREGTQAQAEEKLAKATEKQSKAQEHLNLMLSQEAILRQKYDEAKAKYGENSDEARQAKAVLDIQHQIVEEAGRRVETTREEAAEAENLVGKWKNAKDLIAGSATAIAGMIGGLGDVASSIATMTESLGGSDEDVQYWNDIADGLNKVAGSIDNIVQAAMQGNVTGIVSSVLTIVPNMISGFSKLFNAGKVKRANKEIKRQQELLDELQYRYSRLEQAVEKLFGGEYVANYKQQLKNLQAQAQAYQKQAQAERSKGKDKDKAKIKEYENAYRETMDKIADMRDNIAAQNLGSEIEDAARNVAKAWLNAYKEIGAAGASTTKAMKEQFNDMVENMVVEGALGAVMEKALRPMYDMIGEMNEQDFYSEDFWRKVVAAAQRGAENADHGAQTMMHFLESAGISVRDLNNEFTGIKRNVAGASEESVTGLSAGIATQNYYMSHVPGMAANLAVIRSMMESGSSLATNSKGYADMVSLQTQAVNNLSMIQRYTGETVARCERAAVACEEQVALLRKVIVPRGSKGAFGVQTWM